MSKIGIICAVDRELSPFLEKLHPKALPPQAMLTFYQGQMGEHQIILVRCGVCKVNAAIAAQALIDLPGGPSHQQRHSRRHRPFGAAV